MKKILINKNGYVQSPYIKDATIELEVTDDLYKQVNKIPFNCVWHYINGKFVLEALLDETNLRERRNRECFRLADNRSPMWYNRLTETQKTELDTWYQAWLDVTKTKVIPTKPDWLK